MKSHPILRTLTPLCATLLAAGTAHATNGMLMEGYGPISTGMGGASQAMDHGTAAMAQNPATLGLMADGTARLDVALGVLGPDVKSSVPGLSAKSGGDAYIMPAFGYARRKGAWTYGFGLFAQGGMGTEYDATSFMSAGAGQPARSELGVGNVLLPLAYQVNDALTVGATFKFMWGSLDMMMNASGQQLGGMVQSYSGNLAQALPALASAPWARISFSDDGRFSGAAKATGWGASLGATYRVSPSVMLGGSYLLKSNLNDMETSSGGATMSAAGGFSDSGRITVIDFQLPAVFSLGASWQATPSLLLAADVKQIAWSDSMKNFRLRYDSAQMGGSVGFALPQDWKDQTVLNLGLAYRVNEALTLRTGLNLAENPVPDSTVNPLFPATVRDHLTLGLGYKTSKTGELNVSLTYAPTVSVSSGSGVAIDHGQTNWQLMYSHAF